MVRRAALFALAAALALSCRRKAPGPEECRSFALKMLRLGSEDDLSGRTRQELALRDQVDALTRECLVLPYDRPLLRCVEETGGAPACRTAFNRRRGGGAEHELRR
jgi:hypothetical protein